MLRPGPTDPHVSGKLYLQTPRILPTLLKNVRRLHSLDFVMPCPPSRTGGHRYLPVAEPGDRLKVVSVGQSIDLGAVDAHLLELMETTRVVKVGVSGDG